MKKPRPKYPALPLTNDTEDFNPTCKLIMPNKGPMKAFKSGLTLFLWVEQPSGVWDHG